MPLILGIDTGGTYTDSVILDTKRQAILYKAKAFTTPGYLPDGILESMKRLNFPHFNKLSMVCLSTTLATNALIEKKGSRVGAMILGRDIDKSLPAAKISRLRGLMNIKGRILEDISPEEVVSVARSWEGTIDAVAVSGFASVRNPLHETRVRDIVREELRLPVICAHELSGALGFYERTVTAVLNASLIPNISCLIEAVGQSMERYDIHAPLMIVKGDGSLMDSGFALNRPIETVLSGPAASIAGGLFLSGETEALLMDMGGTTSDFALVKHGQVPVNDSGAKVGGWYTRLRAAEISTFGIGGDSRIFLTPGGGFSIGPVRVMPLCVAASMYPGLEEELSVSPSPGKCELPEEQCCECYLFLRKPLHRPATKQEIQLFRLLSDGPHSLFYLTNRMEPDSKTMITELVKEGVLQRIGLTPTDLLHVSGQLNLWNSHISRVGASLMANALSLSLERFCACFFSKMQARLQECCMQAATNFSVSPDSATEPPSRLTTPDGSRLPSGALGFPVVALGAPAASWMPAVCESFHTKLVIPQYAEVANAVGAAIGQVILTVEALIRPDQYHKGYVVHGCWGNKYFEQLSDSRGWARSFAGEYASLQAAKAGGGSHTIHYTVEPTYSRSLTGKDVFIQEKITATVIARPNYIKKED